MEWLRAAWETLSDVWGYRLLTIEGESLSVGRIIAATALILLALFLSRRISAFIGRRLLPRLNLSLGAVGAVQSLTFYLLLGLFTLTALRLANVPLTVFAVLGGAVAIGIGFGSQNIVNNFISGVILMIEQPVKQGDLIEVDATLGTVEMIGTRSTTVRTPDNTHIVLPNSSLLESPVLNWTLSDNMVRTAVKIGIAYGADVDKAADIMRKIASDHGDTLEEPAPLVLFTDFGDNALGFELVFWVRLLAATDRRRIQSDLRFAINRAFNGAGIVIAFPQRDLHIDTLAPLEVRVMQPAS